ncbi:MAG: AzlD domain-containing protein [Alphaproteobacteria bacterium]|nr:AzlD domain-containing protein [Alphaproteobacteria bacterium]
MTDGATDPALTVVIVAILASFVWRALGAVLAHRINPEGRVFRWFTCVSYAVLAGLLTRLLILPMGDLASVDLTIRVAAAGVGVAVFFLTRRNLLVGVVAGTGGFALAVALTT